MTGRRRPIIDKVTGLVSIQASRLTLQRMPSSYIQARRQHYRGIVAIGQRINNPLSRVHKDEVVPIVVQPIADAAISYEHYIAGEIRKVIVKTRPSRDHSEAAGSEQQARKVIGAVIVSNSPVGQINCPVRSIK